MIIPYSMFLMWALWVCTQACLYHVEKPSEKVFAFLKPEDWHSTYKQFSELEKPPLHHLLRLKIEAMQTARLPQATLRYKKMLQYFSQNPDEAIKMVQEFTDHHIEKDSFFLLFSFFQKNNL